nr:glycosyltransferase [Bacillota bacterium]
VGDGELREKMESLVKELEIKDNVVFTGSREDIPKILKVMDIFVLPSLWEGLPIVLLEAMASKKPIVATDVIGNKEVVVDGKTAFLVPPKNPGRLAEKIISLIKNKPLREKFGESGRRRVEETYPLDRMVKETEEVYHEAL